LLYPRQESANKFLHVGWIYQQMNVFGHEHEANETHVGLFNCRGETLGQNPSPRVVRQQRHSMETGKCQLVEMARLMEMPDGLTVRHVKHPVNDIMLSAKRDTVKIFAFRGRRRD
jgi:hypothetical protein